MRVPIKISDNINSKFSYLLLTFITGSAQNQPQGLKNIFTGKNKVRLALLLRNRHMTTAHSNEIDSQFLIDLDPGSGSEIQDLVPKHW